jgi:HK97 family phage major capsid protein
VSGEDSLLSMTDQQTASGNSITFPIDETTAWQSAGGVLAYWGSEAAAMTQSKPALKESTLKLDKLTALIPVTDELLEDAAAMGSYVAAKAGEKINFKVNDAIINGTGVGQPLGIMNAACTVSVAKETNQAAATILGLNLLKMYSRMPSMNRRRAVWLINQDIESQLMSVNIETKNVAGSENVSGMPAYLPPGGLSGSPYATLFGRPIIATEGCQTIGTVGDIVFADLGSYLTVVKSGGVRADTSIHLWFDQNTTAFRFTLRMAGQPWLSAAIARKNGSNTLSHFVTLATR